MFSRAICKEESRIEWKALFSSLKIAQHVSMVAFNQNHKYRSSMFLLYLKGFLSFFCCMKRKHPSGSSHANSGCCHALTNDVE